jgi:hypothetical protein
MIRPEGEEAMVDRLVAEHENGLHENPWLFVYNCPRCEEQIEEEERRKLPWKRKCT